MSLLSKEDLVLIDQLIRSGQFKLAKISFKKINIKTVQRRDWAFYAQLSWRLGLANYGLRLLGPLIREMKESESKVEERAEYIACLNSIGSTEEALLRFRNESQKENPWIQLYGAFVAISQWDYEAAAINLESLTHSGKFHFIPEYNQSVARINLLASLIAIADWKRANSLMIELKQDLNRPGFERLLTNLQELNLQLLVGQDKTMEAKDQLGELNLDQLQGPERLYQLKWRTVIELKSMARDGQFNKESYLQLRAEAAQAGRWEVLRDIDAKIAIYFKNPIFLKRVLFASPWVNYKEKILNEFGTLVQLEPSFDFRMLPNEFLDFSDRSKDQRIEATYDIKNGNSTQGLELKIGQLSHRLLRVLAADLYRSHSVGSIFAKIFPDEFYNPISAPNRVHQAVSELNEELTKTSEPLYVQSLKGGYRLNTPKPIVLQLPARGDLGRLSIQLGILFESFQHEKFDVDDAALSLNCHKKKAQRIVKEGLELGHLQRSGSGRGVRYCFVSRF